MAKKKNTAESSSVTTLVELHDDPHRLCRELIQRFWRCEKGLRIRVWNGDWFLWTGRSFSRVPDAEMRARITQQVKSVLDNAASSSPGRRRKQDSEEPVYKTKVTRSLVSDVMQALQGHVFIPATFEPPVWLEERQPPQPQRFVAFRNGLVDVDALLRGQSDVLRPHSPQWFSTLCLTYDYAPTATCPRWLGFLAEILEFDAERIALLQEFFAHCLLVPEPARHKFLVLVGEGANGKSVVLIVMTAALGADNVSNIPLELFGQRFQLTATLGKLANIAAEVSELDRLAEGVLKAFTAGDPMSFERKNRDPISARPTAKLIFSTNNLPRFADRSDGIWRRALVLPFRVTVPPDRQNPRLAGELSEELPGLFNWCVEGARRLLVQDRFTEPAICRAALEQHRAESNPARTFILENFEFRRGSRRVCSEVYGEYRFYCDGEGRAPLDASHFSVEVTRAIPEVRTERSRGGRTQPRHRVFEGLAKKEEPRRGTPVAVPQRRTG
jgi:P4 family phage/plasmid primase-like protien